MQDNVCIDCCEYINKCIELIERDNVGISIYDACKILMSTEIKKTLIECGNEIYQVTEKYCSPWDADNTNIMLALYCVLFPKIKPQKVCLRDSSIVFYECKRCGRVGETLNTFGTMFGTEIAKERIAKFSSEDKKELNKLTRDFQKKYHEPGNFMPFPGSLNYSKGYDNTGWAYLGEFFDIKLNIIKEQWDGIKRGNSSVPLLNINKDFFNNFDKFEEFCEYFYLNKYVEIGNLCNHFKYDCYRPKPFNLYNCRMYIKNATDIIDYRSKQMANKLEKILSKWRKES